MNVPVAVSPHTLPLRNRHADDQVGVLVKGVVTPDSRRPEQALRQLDAARMAASSGDVAGKGQGPLKDAGPRGASPPSVPRRMKLIHEDVGAR